MKNQFRIPTIFLSAFILMFLLSSCGKKLTVCECMNPPDKNYEERCRAWFTNAPSDEYAQMMKEKENCK
ncbi:MAG: hypothetical protein AB7P01_11795 [Bacteroidia bacterium]